MNLSYYNADGSFHSFTEYEPKATLDKKILAEIRKLRDKGKLPNLSKAKKNVHVLIETEKTSYILLYKKRITVSSAKAKGRNAQQWVAKKIGELLNLPWGYDEQIAPREMGQSGTDIRLVADAKDLFPWSIEIKNCESWNVPAFIRQAKENQLPGTDWLVVMKKNNHEYVTVLDAEVFFDILRLMRGSKKGR